MSGLNISQSDIKNLKQCRRLALTLLAQPRHQKEGPARVGTAAHAIMAAYVLHLAATGQESDLAYARAFAEQTCAVLGFDDEVDLRSFIFSALEKVDLSWVPHAKAIFVEQRFHLLVSGSPATVPDEMIPPVELAVYVARGGTVFSGTPDVWWVDQQDVLHVLDWKSGRIIEHIESPSESYQLRLYGGAIAGTMAAESTQVLGHIVHLRHGAFLETSGYVDPDCAPIPWDASALRPWMRDVVLTAAAYLRGRVPEQSDATYGGHCTRCDCQAGCRAYADRVAPGASDPVSPVEALVTAKVLEARAKVLLSRVREALDTMPVVSDGFFTAVLKESTKRSEWKSSAFTALRDMLTEDELAKVCQPTKTRLAAAFKKRKVADMLDAFCSEHQDVQIDTEMSITVAKARPDDHSVPAPNGES